jgi:hypothetical protein
VIRRWAAVLVAIGVLVTMSGCRDDGRWSTAPGAPSLQPTWGARVTDGLLQIWMGSPCLAVTRIVLGHNFGGPDLVLTANSPDGAAVERLTLGGPYPGFTVAEDWPSGLNWRSADQLVLQVDGEGVNFGASSNVAKIVDGSDDHPEDTYWFDGVGWLNPSEVAEQDGKTFAAVCTPNPAQDSS